MRKGLSYILIRIKSEGGLSWQEKEELPWKENPPTYKLIPDNGTIDTLTIYVEKFVSGFSSLGRQVKKCNSGEGKHRTELLEQEREQLAARKFQLYEKYRSGKISRETFQQENMMITDRIKDIAEMLDEYRNRKEDAFESISGVYDKLCDDIVEIGKFDVKKYRQFIKYVAIYDEESLEVVWNINDPMQSPQ